MKIVRSLLVFCFFIQAYSVWSLAPRSVLGQGMAWLNQIPYDAFSDKVRSIRDSDEAQDAIKLQDKLRKSFPKDNDISAVYRPEHQIGQLLGLVEFGEKGVSGGAFLWSDSPPLNLAQHHDFVKLREIFSDLKNQSAKEFETLLQALEIDYYLDVDQHIYYVSGPDLQKWYRFYDLLKELYQQVTRFTNEVSKDPYSARLDFLMGCLSKDTLTVSRKIEILIPALTEFFRSQLIVQKVPIYQSELGSTMVGATQRKALYFNRPYTDLVSMFVLLLSKKDGDKVGLNSFLFLPKEQIASISSLLSDWLREIGASSKIGNESNVFIEVTFVNYILETYLYVFLLGESLDEIPFENNPMNFRKSFLKHVQYISSGRMSRHEQMMYPDSRSFRMISLEMVMDLFHSIQPYFGHVMGLSLNHHFAHLWTVTAHLESQLGFLEEALKLVEKNLNDIRNQLFETDTGARMLIGDLLSQIKAEVYQMKFALHTTRIGFSSPEEFNDVVGLALMGGGLFDFVALFELAKIVAPDNYEAGHDSAESKGIYAMLVENHRKIVASIQDEDDKRYLRYLQDVMGYPYLLFDVLFFWDHAWPPDQRSKKISELEGIFRRRTSSTIHALMSPAAALALGYHYLLLAQRSLTPLNAEAFYKAQYWFHCAFESVSLAVMAREKLSSSGQVSGYIELPNNQDWSSHRMQEIQRLNNYALRLMMRFSKRSIIPTTFLHGDGRESHFNLEIKLINDFIRAELDKKTPDWEQVLFYVRYRSLLEFSQGDSSVDKAKTYLELIKKKMPDELLLELFKDLFAQLDRSSLILAFSFLEYWKINTEAMQGYPLTIAFLEENFSKTRDENTLIALVQHHFESNHIKQAINELDNWKEMVQKGGPLFSRLKKVNIVSDDVFNLWGAGFMRPYVRRLERAQGFVLNESRNQIHAWLQQEQQSPLPNPNEILGEIQRSATVELPTGWADSREEKLRWSGEDEKKAIIEVFREDDYIPSIYLNETLGEGKSNYQAVMSSNKAKVSHEIMFWVQLANRSTKIRRQTEVILKDISWAKPFSIEDQNPDAVRQKLLESYQEFLKYDEFIQNILRIKQLIADKKFVTAAMLWSNVKQTVMSLDLSASVRAQLDAMEKNLERQAGDVHENRNKIRELIRGINRYETSGELVYFANLSGEIQWLESQMSKYADLLDDLFLADDPMYAYCQQLTQYDAIGQLVLVGKLKEYLEHVQGWHDEAWRKFESLFEQNIPDKKPMQDFLESLEKLRHAERRMFNQLLERIKEKLTQQYQDVYPELDPLTRHDHQGLQQRTYLKIVQLEFISSALLQYVDNINHAEVSKAKKVSDTISSPIRQVYFLSHEAKIIHIVKVHRLMLNALLEVEIQKFKIIEESFAGQRRKPLKSAIKVNYRAYQDKPSVSPTEPNQVILPLGQITDFYPRTTNLQKKIQLTKKAFQKGDRFTFYTDIEHLEKALFEDQKIPIFELERVDEKTGDLVFKIINQDQFTEKTTFEILAHYVPSRGYMAIEASSNIRMLYNMMDVLARDLIGQAGQLKLEKNIMQQKPIQYHVGPETNNLINALLGLSTNGELRFRANHWNEEPPVIDEQTLGLNEAQNIVRRHVGLSRSEPSAENRLILVQAPGGSGKTHVARVLIQDLARKAERAALAAPTHAATDNLALKALQADLAVIRLANHANEHKMNPQVRNEAWANREALLEDDLKRGSGGIHAYTLTGFQGDPIIRKVIERLYERRDIPAETADDKMKRTFIQIDEAGMASLPEVLYFLSSLATPRATVVLWGDQMQLMPYGIGEHKEEILSYISKKEFKELFGVDPDESLFADWMDDIISTSVLELRHGGYGSRSYTLKDIYRSTQPIVEVLKHMGYLENGIPMESRRSSNGLAHQLQVMYFNTNDRSRDTLLDPRHPGSYYESGEINRLLIQMDKDFETVSDLDGSQITFISPYKSQIELFKQSLWAMALIGELKRLQAGGDFVPISNLEQIVASIEKLINRFGSGSVNFSDLFKANHTGSISKKEVDELLKKLIGSSQNGFRGALPGFIPKKASAVNLARIQGFSAVDLESELDATTIQKAQGRENRAVYISFVRNNDRGNLGFMFSKRGQGMQITAVGRAEQMVRIAANEKTWIKASERRPASREEVYRYTHGVRSAERMLSYIAFAKKLREGRSRFDSRQQRVQSESVMALAA